MLPRRSSPLRRLAFRAVGAARQSAGHTQVGDQDIHPAAQHRGPYRRELAVAAGHRDAARHGAVDVGGDADDAVVQLGVEQGSVLVEEVQADVAHRAEPAQLLLVVVGEDVAAAAQQR